MNTCERAHLLDGNLAKLDLLGVQDELRVVPLETVELSFIGGFAIFIGFLGGFNVLEVDVFRIAEGLDRGIDCSIAPPHELRHDGLGIIVSMLERPVEAKAATAYLDHQVQHMTEAAHTSLGSERTRDEALQFPHHGPVG